MNEEVDPKLEKLAQSRRFLVAAFGLMQRSYHLAEAVSKSDCDYWPLEQRLFRIWDEMDTVIDHWEL